MIAIIEQCVARRSEAWAELWVVYKHVAAKAVRRLLARAGFSETEADDVANELFEYFFERECRRLRTFEGTEAQFSTWLVHVSKNLAHNWIDREWRRIDRERKLRKCLPIEDRTGPTIGEVLSLLKDLESVLSREDIVRLRGMIGLSNVPSESDSPAPELHATVAQRTWRRWKNELEEKIRGL